MAEHAGTQPDPGRQSSRPPAKPPGGKPGREKREWARQLGEQVQEIETLSAGTIVAVAEQAGKRLADKREVDLKTTQIRRFLTELREIESKLKHDPEGVNVQDRVILLRPKLAYAAGRQWRQVTPLMEILDPAMKQVKSRAGFENLLRLVEGIVAYHRYYGGE